MQKSYQAKRTKDSSKQWITEQRQTERHYLTAHLKWAGFRAPQTV